MHKGFIDKMLAAYSSESIIIQKKIKVLFVINIVIIIFSLLYAFFSLFILHSMQTAMTFIVAATILFGSVFIIKIGKYIIASNITIFSVFLGLVHSSFSNVETPTPRSLYVVAVSMLFVLILCNIIGVKKYQFLIIIPSILIVMFVFFFTFIYKLNEDLSVKLNALISSLILLLLSDIFTYAIFNIVEESLALSEEEALVNKRRFEELQKIMDSSRNGLQIGKDLNVSANQAKETLNKFINIVHKFDENINDLSEKITLSSEANRAILDAMESLKIIMNNQNASISETSAAIEEMSASLNNINKIASNKKESIGELDNLIKNGITKISNSQNAIKELKDSANEILSILDIINTISTKTNLLAMNAAIEAAHAGEQGKGFAIVAQEIRKLSQNTNANTNLIQQAIEKTHSDIETTSQLNNAVNENFNIISKEIMEVSSSMYEIINGIEEVSKGTSDILEAISSIIADRDNEITEIKDVEGKIKQSSNSINTVKDFISGLATAFQEMVKDIETINTEINNINSIGEENIKQIENLANEIKNIE